MGSTRPSSRRGRPRQRAIARHGGGQVAEDTCRFCLQSEPASDLISPCACSGSAAWVHNCCLSRWRRSGGIRKVCEVCRSPYSSESSLALGDESANPLRRVLEAILACAPSIFLAWLGFFGVLARVPVCAIVALTAFALWHALKRCEDAAASPILNEMPIAAHVLPPYSIPTVAWAHGSSLPLPTTARPSSASSATGCRLRASRWARCSWPRGRSRKGSFFAPLS